MTSPFGAREVLVRLLMEVAVEIVRCALPCLQEHLRQKREEEPSNPQPNKES